MTNIAANAAQAAPLIAEAVALLATAKALLITIEEEQTQEPEPAPEPEEPIQEPGPIEPEPPELVPEPVEPPPVVSPPVIDPPSSAAGILIPDLAALNKALAGSIAGETLLLAEGVDFGVPNFRALVFQEPVTIRGGRYGALSLRGVQGVVLDGAEVASLFVSSGWGKQGNINPERITLRGLRSAGWMQLRGVTDFTVEDCVVTAGQFGITVLDCVDGVMRGNDVSGFTDDAYRIVGGSRRILMEENIAHHPNAHRVGVHSDCLQMFGQGDRFAGTGRTPSDITIRHNIFRGQPLPRAKGEILTQGILIGNAMSDAGFRNVLIEENLIDSGAAHSIYIEGGQENVVVRHNTCLPARSGHMSTLSIYDYGDGHPRGYDNRGTTIEGNIAGGIYNMSPDTMTPGTPGPNHLYGWSNAGFALPTGALTDFLPLDGAGIPDDMGATRWLRERLAGA